MSSVPGRFAGKVALVTGASRGIGFAVAERLVSEGARVCITARKTEALEAAVESLGGKEHAMLVAGKGDDTEHHAAAVAAAIDGYGRLDVLVNNTGINPAFGPMIEQELSAARKVFDVNVIGVVGWIKAAYDAWLGANGGAIVNIASIAGTAPAPGLGYYAASKAALIQMTAAARLRAGAEDPGQRGRAGRHQDAVRPRAVRGPRGRGRGRVRARPARAAPRRGRRRGVLRIVRRGLDHRTDARHRRWREPDEGSGMTFASVDALRDAIGKDLGYSDWITIDQARINQFADATGDHQWIHVDPERAAQGPFKTTIAHGYLTLSLLPVLTTGLVRVDGVRMGVNYGVNKVRFPAPVPVDSRVRARVEIVSVEDVGGGVQVTSRVTIEREGGDKPVCVAESVARFYS